MSKVNDVSGSGSVSSASCNSVLSDLDETPLENGKEKPLNVTKEGRPASSSKARRAKRIRFLHNGNKYFHGIVVPVTSERYRSFESLVNELTKILMKNVTLPCGVWTIYSTNGQKICSLDELEEGKDYVCCGKGESFKKINYNNCKNEINKTNKKHSNSLTRSCSNSNSNTVPKVVLPNCVRPRIVTIIRNGLKPRKIMRLLLNKRNASSMDQVLGALTEAAQLDSGAVRKVFTLSGKSVNKLEQFFDSEDVFFVYGNERWNQDNFELDFEESKIIQKLTRRMLSSNKNGMIRKPELPKKEHNNVSYDLEDDKILLNLSIEEDSDLPSSIRQNYTIDRVIGDGNFAVVRVCVDKKDNKEYALKIIDKTKCNGKEEMIENEVNIMRQLNHPNVMNLFSEAATKTKLYLICEYVDGGDLFDAITREQKFSEDQAALMMQHLASALSYLHNLNIVHRDVKPENLLVTREKDKIKWLKLGDFGLACRVKKPLYIVCGTPTYVAPEILAESGYGLKIDVWAAGVILFVLLCGYPPFVSEDNDQEKLFDLILSGQYEYPEEYWHDVSNAAKELINNMLQLDPDLRFSSEDVLDHPWLIHYTQNNVV